MAVDAILKGDEFGLVGEEKEEELWLWLWLW